MPYAVRQSTARSPADLFVGHDNELLSFDVVVPFAIDMTAKHKRQAPTSVVLHVKKLLLNSLLVGWIMR